MGMEMPQKPPIPAPAESSSRAQDALARRAAFFSLIVSLALLALKIWGYRLTGSQAVFSDAMETIVNVVAASLAIVVLIIAQKPADRDHPYGHGKIEYFSAAFEGGLIAFASILICAEAIRALIRGPEISQIGLGLAVTIGAGVVNALLGAFLIRAGKRHQSATLEASGQHVLSDFWTSAGVTVGLVLVWMTGLTWLDPLVALVVGLWLGRTGLKLVRRSVGSLLDEEDQGLVAHLAQVIGKDRPPGIIQVHHVRVMRSGRYHHIDAHAVVPEYWDVAEAHRRTDEFEESVMRNYPFPGEIHLHVDPCRRAYCRECSMPDCPIRRHPFEQRRSLTVDEMTSPEEPRQERPRN
jgi:cation diffusion facilitator family transporter